MAGCSPGAIFGNHHQSGTDRLRRREAKEYAEALRTYESKSSKFFSVRNVNYLTNVNTAGNVSLEGATVLERVKCRGLFLLSSMVKDTIECGGKTRLIGVSMPGNVHWKGSLLVIRKSKWLEYRSASSTFNEVRLDFSGEKNKKILISGTKIQKLIFVNGGTWRFTPVVSDDGKMSITYKVPGASIQIENCEVDELFFE